VKQMGTMYRVFGGHLAKSFVLASVAALGAACDGDSPPPQGTLLDGAADKSLSREEERIRQMQLLRVVDPDGLPKDWSIEDIESLSDGEFPDITGDSFVDAVNWTCHLGSIGCGRADPFDPFPPLPWVTHLGCSVAEWKCQAELLQAMVTDPSSVQLRLRDNEDDDSGQIFTVLPQAAATNAKLATESGRIFSMISRRVREMIDEDDSYSHGILGTSDWAFKVWAQEHTPNASALTAADHVGSTLVDSYYGAKESFQLAVDNTLAVADAELATTPSLSLARQRSITKPALSRMAAAHLLVGGSAGFLGSETEPFCSSGRLSGPEQTALGLLRETAVAPADLLNASITTKSLVDGPEPPTGTTSNTLPNFGSVKARLGDSWGSPLAANQSVFALYSLTEADFDAARKQIRDEIAVFGRSSTATLRARPDVNGTAPKYARFAATATIPQERERTYWSALALTDSADPTVASGADGWYRYGNRRTRDIPWDYSSLVDGMLDDVEAIFNHPYLRTTEFGDQGRAEEQAGLMAPLATLLHQRDRAGRFTQCNFSSATWITVTGLISADEPRYVFGDDVMSCAVKGDIDGAPCNLTATDLHAFTIFGYDVGKNRSGVAASTTSFAMSEAPYGKRLYVVRPRLRGNTTGGPGQWEAVVGTPLYDNRIAGFAGSCRDVPIVPEAIERVGKIMAPSRDWCGASQFSCAGASIDERMPLEDELSNDQDGVESSWKHYLTLARAAAVESDRLGEEYINAALGVDERNEELSIRAQQQQEKAAAELEALQDICGTAVDPAALLKVIGSNTEGDFDLNNIDHGPCTGTLNADLPEGAPPGSVCQAGRAILSWTVLAEAEPELKELANCIASFADTISTSFGDLDVCAWTDDDGALCSPVDGYRCPDLKHSYVDPMTMEESSKCSTPSGKKEFIVSKDDALRLFSTIATLPPAPKKSLCDSIRVLRKNPAGDDPERAAMLKELVDSNHFDQTWLLRHRNRIQFEATVGGYVEVKIDGKRAFGTGSAQVGPSSEWPCGATGQASNCDVGEGLFCDVSMCSNEPGRKEAAERLFNAVAAAQLTTYGGGDDPKLPMWLPAYLQRGAKPLGGVATQFIWSAQNDAPLQKYSNDRWQLITGDFDFVTYQLFDGSWKLSETNGKRFVIANTTPSNAAGLRPKFWGGMSRGIEGNAEGDPKYFYSLLANGATGLVNPGLGASVSFGSDITFRRGCSDSCWALYQACGTGHFLCPGCDCYNRSDSHMEYLDEDLEGQLLESNDYDGDDITYADLKPITYNYADETLLDGLELLCEVSEGFGDRATACDVKHPPLIKSVDDLSAVGSYLQCVGDELSNKIALTILPDFPAAALDPLKTGIVPPKGQIGTAISTLRSALLRVAMAGPTISRTIRDFGLDMKRLRETIAIYDVDDEISDVQFESTVMDQTTSCIVKTMDEVGRVENKVTFGVTAAAASAATCINSAAQIGFANKLRDLNQEKTRSERQLAVIDFNERFSGHTETLEKQAIELADAMEEVQRQLGIINDLHTRAQRTLDKALWLLSVQATNQAEISSVLGSRSKTAEIRYQRAFDNAKHMAFLAGRAIEQRLGINLAEMNQELPLVEPPSTWASTVCTTSGIDYAKLRTANRPADDGGVDSGSSGAADTSYNFADAYIGDYVTKLENVVESYRLTQNFHEGTDTAVVSLRDDVFNLRQDCEVESTNLLYWASALDRLTLEPTPERLGWSLKGCGIDATGDAIPSCITVTQHENAPFVDLRPQLRTVPGFQVKFGDGGACPTATCGYRDGAAIVQTVALEPGRYRFSWFTPDAMGSAATLGGFIRNQAGKLARITAGFRNATANRWARQYFLVDISTAGDYEVGFDKPADTTATSFNIGAPMLERIDVIAGQTSSAEPKMFSNTTDVRTSILAVCPDADGSVFRDKKWDRGCTYLCPDGYSSDCRDQSRLACYWETSLHVSQRAIEAGQQFKHSGFARGNFNYRVDSLGLNFVGTALRACDDSEVPDACYGSGFIPFSIIHAGPYFIRNHEGRDYEAKLFTGLIEHARGLATERYITNPMSDSDRSLMTPYLREELQGRPLDGDYVLRVWDEEGVDFDRIEDVQLVLNYRYWTRFN
jgi:hypothetical protein